METLSESEAPLPLYLFFKRLQAHGFPLGVGDYHGLAESLRMGIGLENKQKLLFLCKTLWLKPGQDEPLFERLFAMALEAGIQSLPLKEEAPVPAVPDAQPRLLGQQDGMPDKSVPPLKKRLQPSATPITPQPPVMHSEISLAIQPVSGPAPQMGLRAGEGEFPQPAFLFSGSNYMPVTGRQIQQAWRLLRRYRSGGLTKQVDMPATVEKKAREGYLTDLVYHPGRRNTVQLVILIDHGGSMVAFRELAEQLAEAAGGILDLPARLYYFYNVPDGYVYEDYAHTRAVAVEDLASGVDGKDCAVLIISDAGAARGRYDPGRVAHATRLIGKLRKQTANLVLLNPMPQGRWRFTSAHYLRDQLPMFEISPAGLRGAVRVLGGKTG